MSPLAPPHLWLPFTQMAEYDRHARSFVRGEGALLYDAAGKASYDCVSSIWTTLHGHCHPHITRRIAEQAGTLDHATLLGATNPVAEELAAKLAQITGLERAFFSGDGASAVEVALKMALQYWQNAGVRERTRIVRLSGAYHGDTAGAMSVSDIGVFKSRFAPFTFETYAYDAAPEVLEAPDVAAVIVEPLVQAAAGIRVVPRALYEPLETRSTLLIVDEIATGFGRTGSMFAYEQLDLQPDIVCLGKGLTGGALALSATMASAEIFRAFLGSHGALKQLFHGHSFAGNPIACAAALASLEIFEEEATLERVRSLSETIRRELMPLADLPQVAQVRGVGCMFAVEIRPERFARTGAMGPAWDIADRLYECAPTGFFTRPIGNAIQYVPPFCTTAEEVALFAAALRAELQA